MLDSTSDFPPFREDILFGHTIQGDNLRLPIGSLFFLVEVL
jgi:hypothetical protein